MRKMGKKKYTWILWSILGIALIFGVVCVAGAMGYVNRVPKITASEPLEATCGTTLLVSDLAEITCKGKYTVRLAIAETNVNTARVLEGQEFKPDADGTKQEREASKSHGDVTNDPALYVGDEAGYIHLVINATGSVAEYVSASVTIYVKPGEAEQAQILKEAEDQFVKIKEYLQERDFSDQKEILDEELVTLYYLDPARRIGYAKYYLKRTLGEQERINGSQKLYYEVLANYELVSKDAGPQLKDVLVREIDEEAFHHAQELPEKVILIEEKDPSNNS